MTSEADMCYEAVPDIVWVNIQGKNREKYKLKEAHWNFVDEFMKWLWDEKIRPYKNSMSGGGFWQGAFFKEDWPRVKEWLDNNGANEKL